MYVYSNTIVYSNTVFFYLKFMGENPKYFLVIISTGQNVRNFLVEIHKFFSHVKCKGKFTWRDYTNHHTRRRRKGNGRESRAERRCEREPRTRKGEEKSQRKEKEREGKERKRASKSTSEPNTEQNEKKITSLRVIKSKFLLKGISTLKKNGIRIYTLFLRFFFNSLLNHSIMGKMLLE